MQIDEFIPQENLVVNKTKLTQITDWIDERISLSLGGRSSNYHCLLLLTGPAGCGKTASIRAICQKKGLHLVEWSDPTFSSFQSIQTTEQRSTDHSTTLFREFLFEGRKYEPLTFESPESAKTIVTRQLESFSHRPKTSPTHILLVDGLPYFPNRTMSKAFSDIVFEFINSFSVQAGVESILGLIITLTTTNNLTEQDFVKKQLLLSPEYVKHINLAPLAPTFLTKQLLSYWRSLFSGNRLAPLHQFVFEKTFMQDLIVSIIYSSRGDIRSAIHTAEMISGIIKYRLEDRTQSIPQKSLAQLTPPPGFGPRRIMLLTPPSTPQTQQKQSLASPSPQTVFSPQFRMVENADTIFQEIKERLFSGDDELLVKKDEAASIYPYLVRLLGNKPNSEIQEESDEDDDKPDPRTPTKKAQNERFFSRRKNDIDRKVGRILDREMKIKEPRSRKKKTALQPSPITKVKRDEPTDGLESQDWENSVQKVMRLGIREEEKETMLDLQMNMSQFDNEEEWDDDETQEMGPAKEIYPDWRQVVTTTPLFSANYWNQQPSQSALTDPTNVFIIPPAFSLEERQHVLDHTEEKISSTLHSSLSIDFPPPSQIPNTPLNVSSYLQHCTTQPQSLLLFLHQNLPIYGPEWPRGDTSRHDSYFYPPIIQNSDKMNFAFIREYSMSISTLSMVQLQLDVQSSQSSAPSASSPVTTIPTSTLLDLIGWGSTLTRRFTQRNISAQFFPPAPDGTKRPQMIGVQKPEFFAMNERRNDFVMTTQTFFSSALSEKKEKQRQESLFTPVSTSLSSTNVQQSAQRKEAISDEGSSVLREMNTLRTLSTDIIPYLSFLVRERATLSDSNQTTTDLKEDQIEADAKSDASLAQTPRPVLNVPSKFASVREKMNIQREQQNKRSSSPQQELSQGVNISTLIPRPLLPFFSSNTLSCSISSGQRMLTGPPQRLLSLDTATDRFFIEEKVHTAFDESDKFVIDTLEESDKEKPEKQEERKQDDVDDGADDWMNPES